MATNPFTRQPQFYENQQSRADTPTSTTVLTSGGLQSSAGISPRLVGGGGSSGGEAQPQPQTEISVTPEGVKSGGVTYIGNAIVPGTDGLTANQISYNTLRSIQQSQGGENIGRGQYIAQLTYGSGSPERISSITNLPINVPSTPSTSSTYGMGMTQQYLPRVDTPQVYAPGTFVQVGENNYQVYTESGSRRQATPSEISQLDLPKPKYEGQFLYSGTVEPLAPTGRVASAVIGVYDDLIRFGYSQVGRIDNLRWSDIPSVKGIIGFGAVATGYFVKTGVGVLQLPVEIGKDIFVDKRPFETIREIARDLVTIGGEKPVSSPFLKRLASDIRYNPPKAVGELLAYKTGEVFVEGAKDVGGYFLERTPLGTYAKNIKANPIYKNIAYDLSEESGTYGLKNAVKLLGVDIINTEKGTKVLYTKQGYDLYMQEPITLPASLSEQAFAGIKAQSELEGLRRDLGILNERLPSEFSPEKAAIQQLIYEEATKGSGLIVKGSTALVTEQGFKEAYLDLYGEPRIPGDIELSVGKRYRPSKTVSLKGGGDIYRIKELQDEAMKIRNTINAKNYWLGKEGFTEPMFNEAQQLKMRTREIEIYKELKELKSAETSTTVKAKLQLGQENIYNELFKTKEVLAKEKAALKQGLNKNFDITELPDINEQQQFTLKNAPGKIKGSTADKIMDLSRGELKEDATLLGKDIDIEKPIFGKKSNLFVEKYAETFPDITAKQMGIKSVGVTKTLLRDATDYLVEGKEKAPIGSILEVPTGRVLQLGEGVRVKTTEIAFNKYIKPSEYAKQLVGEGKLDLQRKGIAEIERTEGKGADAYFSRGEGKGGTDLIVIGKELKGTAYEKILAHELVHLKTPEILFTFENLVRVPYEIKPSELVAYGRMDLLAERGFKNPEFIKPETTIERLPELKGGKININLTSISSGGTKVVDIALEKSIGMRAGDIFRGGKEITYYDKQGKPLFKTVKELTREFDKADRVINARTLEQVEGGTEKFLGSLERGKYKFGKEVKVKAKGSEAFGAEQALKLAEKEPNLVLTSEPPRQVLSIKGIDKAEPTKIAEFFNEKDFPDLLKSKPVKVNGVQVQSVLGSRVGKVLAEKVRGRYADIPLELDKDFKDLTATKVSDIKQFQERINELDPTSRRIAQGRLNKAIDLFYQSEGRAPITNQAFNSQLDLTSQYLKERILPSRANEVKTYEPIRTQAELDKATEIKLDLPKEKYTKEQLRQAISSKIGRETTSADFGNIYGKAERSLNELSANRNMFNKAEAQGFTNKILSDLNKDIKLSRQKYSESLKQQAEKPQYPRQSYSAYLKYERYNPYGEYYYKGYKGYGYGGYAKGYVKTPYGNYPKEVPYTKVNYAKDIPVTYTKTTYIPKEPVIDTPYTPYYEEPKKTKPPISYISFSQKKKQKEIVSKAPTYNVFLRKRGKFQSIGTEFGRSEALRFGSERALRDIARTFKIIPTGRTKDVFGFEEQFIPRETQFRQYKVRSGKQLATPDMFIQRTSANLQSVEEKQQIADARRLSKIINYDF